MKVLIIEDEKLLADSIQSVLERKGFEVECVYDGETGAEYAELGIYDLLILDVMMPKMNGCEVARADSGQGKADLRPVDLSTLAADALLPFDPVFFEQGLMLSSQLAEGINVNGDAGRLKEVLDILLDNARKYTEPPGTVNVRLERWGHHRCRLTVSNPGPPLSAAEQKDIFKRFYRTDPARSRDGSFGLGLSIAQRITEEHHGRIWVESSGGYNRFTVELPAR